MRKEIHTAEPATSPAAPSRAKIPAPTIDPTPMKAASRTDSRCFCAPAEAGSGSVVAPVMGPVWGSAGAP